MPVIHTHVSVPTTPAQREALKTAYGKAVTAVPGKSEGWLMCPFEDDMPIYFGGSDSKPAAYVEVNVFGNDVPRSAWEQLTEQIMKEVKKHFPSETFNTVIPRNIAISEAPSFGEPVIYYEKKSKGAKAYEELAKEMIKRSKKKK